MKVSLREVLNYDIAKGRLVHNPNHESAADRIGALGRSDPLGAALWRVLGQGDKASFREACFRLADRLEPVDVPHSKLVCLCVKFVQEWVGSPCSTCFGRAHVTTDSGVRVQCVDCMGTGRGAHSAENRMDFLGICRGEYSQYAPLFIRARDVLSKADSRVFGQIARELERPGTLRKKGV